MAATAYILIQTDGGRAADVAAQVAALDGVLTADVVEGPYDVVAAVDVPADELQRMVLSRIQMVPGLTRTLTCRVVRV